MRTQQTRSAVLVTERLTTSGILKSVVEPLTLALALSLAVLGALLGWGARAQAQAPRTHAPAAAQEYVDALCRLDLAYLERKTGEAAGRMPWEPRLTTWAMPCTGTRYLGSLQDRIGRAQYVFTLLQPDGTEVLYVVTFGHDGLVAGVD